MERWKPQNIRILPSRDIIEYVGSVWAQPLAPFFEAPPVTATGRMMTYGRDSSLGFNFRPGKLGTFGKVP